MENVVPGSTGPFTRHPHGMHFPSTLSPLGGAPTPCVNISVGAVSITAHSLSWHAFPGTPYTEPSKMATHAHESPVSLLNDRIHVLDKNAAGSSPAKQVFRNVGAILALVRVSAFALRPSANSRVSLTQPGQEDCQQRFCPTF